MTPKKALSPLKKYRGKVFLAPLLKLVEAAIELATPFLTRYIIDVGIGNPSPDEGMLYTLKMGGIILLLGAVAFAFTLLAQYLSARVSADYGYDLRETLYSHFESLSAEQVDSFGKGKLITILNNDALSLQNGVNMFMRLLLRAPFLITGSAILCFIIDWKSGLVYLGAVSVCAIVIALVVILSPKRYAAVQSSLDAISVDGGDALRGVRPIRAFQKEGDEERDFQKLSGNYKDKSMWIARLNSLVNPLTFAAINLAMVLIVYLGGFSINEGTLTSGSLVSLISYLTLSLTAMVMFSRLIVSLNKAKASQKRIDAFLAIDPSIKEAANPIESGDPSSPIVSFHDVSFSYGSSPEKAVEHLSFSLARGHSLGIIGGTGSGKSTALFLLERFYEPLEGDIGFEGVPLKQIDSRYLHKKIAFVSQKPALYKGTILSNLLLAAPNASEEEVASSLRDSCSDEFVYKFKDGLLHAVEEGGVNLSGGQKQRLLIARALLQKADLLVLDDSLSALDFLSEKKVRANLLSKKGLSLIVVSQRATSLLDFDDILVFDKGHIVSKGSPKELLSNSPIYKEIYEMQVASR